jgi:hypothetical protein
MGTHLIRDLLVSFAPNFVVGGVIVAVWWWRRR